MKKGMTIFIFLFVIIQIQIIHAECSEGQININTATKEELDKITQIGPARAEQIIQLRPFNSVDDLIDVSGIGNITLSKIKEEGLACVNEEQKIPEEVQENNTTEENPIENKDTGNNEENSKNNKSSSEDISESNDKTNYTYNKDIKYSETAEVIKLTPTGKDIKTNSDKENSVSRYAFYGLVTFCILLLVLFVLKIKKEKYNKNEFE